MLDQNLTAGNRRRDQVGAGLDTVRQHRVIASTQAFDTMYGNQVAAGILDPAAHCVDKIRQVDYLRLARRILNYGRAIRQAGRHHQVLGAGHGDLVHDDPGALEAFTARLDVTLLDIDIGTHGLEPAKVHIHRARTDSAAAGQ